MSTRKIALDKEIRGFIAEGDSDAEAARRLYLFNCSVVLEEHPKVGFRILNAISSHFKIPFRAICISGSSQVGYSYTKGKDFVPGDSDLDIAIVDSGLFQRYCEIVYSLTRGYTDLTKFPVKEGVSTAPEFKRYLCRGFFRPDLMPYGKPKQEWRTFFNDLSKDFLSLFKNINAGIFMSQTFFEGKQISTIRKYRREIR
jgi:hypothetical protein